jgi:hypothetical protein
VQGEYTQTALRLYNCGVLFTQWCGRFHRAHQTLQLVAASQAAVTRHLTQEHCCLLLLRAARLTHANTQNQLVAASQAAVTRHFIQENSDIIHTDPTRLNSGF